MTKKEGTKKIVHDLHEKYYKGKKTKGSMAMDPEESRAILMMKARQKGIKNFRILNKAELLEAIQEGTPPERTLEIINQAVARWKAGWGSRKKVEPCPSS